MNLELVAAIKDHLAHGRAPEEIQADVLAAGYSDAEWTMALQAAQGNEPSPALPPVPPPPPPQAATAATSPATAPVPTATAHPAESTSSHTLAIIIVGLSVLTAVAIGAYLWLFTPTWFSALQTGGARVAIPTSADFVPQLFESMTSVRSGRLSGDLTVSMSAREPGVRALTVSDTTYDESELAMMQAFMPQGYSLDASFSGSYDVTNLLSPDTEGGVRVDFSISMPEMLPQRVVLDVEGKVVSDVGVFVRLNELSLPAMFALFVDDSTYQRLTNRWVQVLDAAELAVADNLPSFQKELFEQMTSRAAQIIFDEVATHEFIQVTDARTTTLEGVVGVRYTLESYPEVIPALIRSIALRFRSEFGPEAMPLSERELNQLIAEFEAEDLAELGQYLRDHVTYTVTISEAGHFMQYEAIGKIAPDDLLFRDKQLNLLFRLAMTNHNEPIIVTAPLEFMNRSEAEDILGMTAAREAALRASAQQTMAGLRSQAELSYNANNFSYANICTDPRLVNTFESLPAGADCLAGDQQYRIYTRLTDTTWWCVDAAGFAGEITTPPGPNQFMCITPTSFLDRWQQVLTLPGSAWRGVTALLNQAGQVAGASISIPGRTPRSVD